MITMHDSLQLIFVLLCTDEVRLLKLLACGQTRLWVPSAWDAFRWGARSDEVESGVGEACFPPIESLFKGFHNGSLYARYISRLQYRHSNHKHLTLIKTTEDYSDDVQD